MKKFNIDRISHKIDDNYYSKKIVKKNKIILCGSGRKSNYEIVHNNNTVYDKKYPTYTISREGNIYEHFNPKYYSNYIEDNNLNKVSINISLENMGGLYHSEDGDFYFNNLNEVYEEEAPPFCKSWRKFIYFEPYTKDQMEAVSFLCRTLCLELNVNDDSIGHNVISEDAYFYNGIITKANLNPDYLDLNPSFDWKFFINEIKK